jgi:uncharacterized Zn-binding protein involved in type VI secretion
MGRTQSSIPFSRQLGLADSLNYYNSTASQSKSLLKFYDLSCSPSNSLKNQLELLHFSYQKANTEDLGNLFFISSNQEVIAYQDELILQIELNDLITNTEYSFGNESWQSLISSELVLIPDVTDTLIHFSIRGIANSEFWQVGIEIPITRLAEISPDTSPWPMVDGDYPYEISTYTDNQMIYGHAYVKLGADGVFDKPFLFVEGIDFGTDRTATRNGTFGWSELVSGNENGIYSMLSLMPIFLDSISERGYDLVLLDFVDGAADIKRNAALLQHLIQLCNTHKVGNNENIIAGASMGGIVSRVALREMELNGMCHECSHYICLDSPHLGANIPLSLQATIYFLSEFVPEAESFISEKLERDAAKQLLGYHWGNANVLQPNWFLDFQAYLSELGLPQHTINIAISNGSNIGMPQYSFLDNPLLDEHCNATNWLSGEEIVFKLFPLPGNANYDESTSYSNVLADLRFTQMSWSNWLSPVDVYTLKPSVSIDALDLDYSNGGWSSSIYELVKVFNSSSDFTDACGEINADQYAFKHCFVPLSSALLQGELVAHESMNVSASPFDYCIAANGANEPHSHLSWSHIDFLLDQISEVNTWNISSALNNAEEVSLVEPMKVLRPMHVHSGRLLFTNPAQNDIGDEVQVQFKAGCQNAEFNLSGNMEMRIGFETGNLFAHATVTDSCTIRLSEHQQTTIEKNSSMVLDGGSSLVLNGGTLKLKGSLYLNEGSELILQSGQLILDGGKIELLGGKIHVLDDFEIEQSNSGGYVVCRSGDLVDFDFELGSSLHWNGNSALDSMLVVAEGCMLNDGGDGGWIEFNSAHVVLAPGSHVVSFRKNNFLNSWLEGSATSNYTVQWADLSFYQSRVLQVHVQSDYASFVFRNSVAELNEFNVNFGNYRLEASTFLSSSIVSKHLKSRSRILQSGFYDSNAPVVDESLTELYVYQCNFSNHTTAIKKKGGRLRMRCNLIQSSDIGIAVEKGCLLYLGVNDAAGFNTFSNLEYAIQLENALVPSFFNGENRFESCFMYLAGSVTNASCMTQVHFGRNYFENDVYNKFSVHSTTSTIANAPCYLGFTLGENFAGSCPAGVGQVAIGKSNQLKDKNLIVDVNGLPLELDSVFSIVSDLYFSSDTIYQGKQCMQLLSEALLQVPLDSLRAEELPKIHSAMHFMSWLLDELVQRNEIIYSNNQSDFEPAVSTFFAVLNHFSAESYDVESFHHQFYWEMEKIKALRTLGLSNQALFMLSNLNQCNLESLELDILEYWLCLTNQEMEQNNSYLNESPNASIQFITETEVVFGSQVISPTEIYIYPCVYSEKYQGNDFEAASSFDSNMLGQKIRSESNENGCYFRVTKTGEVKKYLRMR